VNFFGHAHLASLELKDPRFILGATLPDLMTMANRRLSAIDDPLIARGVDHHHDLDRRFHALPAFTALCSAALDELPRQGLGRGAARAVGHIGSELLLDGLLAAQSGAVSTYRRALRAALDERLDAHVVTKAAARARPGAPQSEGDGDLGALLSRLATAPIPEAYSDPAFVTSRLLRILAPRPRLAFDPEFAPAVTAWLHGAQRVLEREQSVILSALRPGASNPLAYRP